MENKLINSIDLNLAKGELESIISNVRLSIVYVTDVNHDGSRAGDLNIGEIKGKDLDEVGTSELTDRIYKPINSNISNYPIAGEFALTLETPLGRFYLSSVNLFNDKSNNIDSDNISGYVNFTDDENTNRSSIKSDKKTQKSVLENNQKPFDTYPFISTPTYDNKFGDVNFYGRYGNRISLTHSDSFNPEIILNNLTTSIEFRYGDYRYVRKSKDVDIPSEINNEINYVYKNQQIILDSNRNYTTIGDGGYFVETSGLLSFISSKNSYFISNDSHIIGADKIQLGIGAEEKIVLGDSFMDDFEKLLSSMISFATNLKKQDKILSISYAADNFLTDINSFGWDKFKKDNYLSKKSYTE